MSEGGTVGPLLIFSISLGKRQRKREGRIVVGCEKGCDGGGGGRGGRRLGAILTKGL
jgi:hypothetical protein